MDFKMLSYKGSWILAFGLKKNHGLRSCFAFLCITNRRVFRPVSRSHKLESVVLRAGGRERVASTYQPANGVRGVLVSAYIHLEIYYCKKIFWYSFFFSVKPF